MGPGGVWPPWKTGLNEARAASALERPGALLVVEPCQRSGHGSCAARGLRDVRRSHRWATLCRSACRFFPAIDFRLAHRILVRWRSAVSRRPCLQQCCSQVAAAAILLVRRRARRLRTDRRRQRRCRCVARRAGSAWMWPTRPRQRHRSSPRSRRRAMRTRPSRPPRNSRNGTPTPGTTSALPLQAGMAIGIPESWRSWPEQSAASVTPIAADRMRASTPCATSRSDLTAPST